MDGRHLAPRREDDLLGQVARLGMFPRLLPILAPDQAQDADLVLHLRIVQLQLHQEAVHLGFRQRIGALLLYGVLGGQHHEQRRHGVTLPRHRDLALLHGFEQGGLHLGGGAVDLVGQDDVAKQGALLEADPVAAGGLLEDFAPGDVGGQQIRGELDAAHLRIEVGRQCLDGASLGEPGQALQQHMAVGQEPQQHVAYGIGLAEYQLGDIGLQLGNLFACRHHCIPWQSEVRSSTASPWDGAMSRQIQTNKLFVNN